MTQNLKHPLRALRAGRDIPGYQLIAILRAQRGERKRIERHSLISGKEPKPLIARLIKPSTQNDSTPPK